MSENVNPAELQKTCLYDRHVALQAKMSPFAATGSSPTRSVASNPVRFSTG